MAYLLSAEANGLWLEIPVEKPEIGDVSELPNLVEDALEKALEEERVLDEDGSLTDDARDMLNKWIRNLNDAGFWMPTGCSLSEIVFNLNEANVFELLTEKESFPIKLEEIPDEEVPELNWYDLTDGLTQKEADWM